MVGHMGTGPDRLADPADNASWKGFGRTMNHLKKIVGLLICLAVTGLAPGCARTQTADTLIAGYLEARGGLERFEGIQTLRMSGRASAGPGREARVTREMKRPGRIRTEFAFQGVTDVYACDGAKCWYVAPSSGVFEPEPMSAERARLAIEQAAIGGPLVDWQAKGHTVELLGKETVAGQDAFKLKVTLENGTERYDYLDAESLLLIRTESMREFRDRTIEVETTFGDYKAVGGVLFPHAITSGAKGKPDVLEVVVEKIELNPPLDDTRFTMPALANGR